MSRLSNSRLLKLRSTLGSDFKRTHKSYRRISLSLSENRYMPAFKRIFHALKKKKFKKLWLFIINQAERLQTAPASDSLLNYSIILLSSLKTFVHLNPERISFSKHTGQCTLQSRAGVSLEGAWITPPFPAAAGLGHRSSQSSAGGHNLTAERLPAGGVASTPPSTHR